MKKYFTRIGLPIMIFAFTLGIVWPFPAQAATASQISEAQRIMTKFAIPTGPVDGIWGPKTAQGICTFRYISGLPVSRSGITSTDLAKLRGFNAAYGSLGSIPAANRNGHSSYFVAHKTCQTMVYVKSNAFHKVFRISTGKSGYGTPGGEFHLGQTRPGWSCSTLYPESCNYHNEGMNAKYTTTSGLYSKYGNMYNKRVINGAVMLHGSPWVPTYPDSHGCVRTTVKDADWLYQNITNSGGIVHISIIGRY